MIKTSHCIIKINMKITTKILCQRVKGPLSQVLYLDISGLGIGAVDGLESCPKLQSLDLSRNCLEEMENFECCKHLWRINLSNNKLRCLNNLSKMYALGTLDLSNNQLVWNDLIHIRHVYILDLRLHGNEKLENDIYYRLHVIDSLPLVWMLDGRLVTSAERLQVQQFFYDSALSNRPVRHKVNENSYLCTKAAKSVEIHGDRTYRLSACFPVHEPHNCDTDKRRLEFLAGNIEEDLKNKAQCAKRPCNLISQNCLQTIIKHRCDEKEKCNMLLLLLISSLEFNLPESLIEQTLEVTKLNPLLDKDTLQLFNLDAAFRTEAISLLVSSCKLDRDVTKPSHGNFTSGGLYDRLYLCLYHSVERLVKKISSTKRLKSGPFNALNDYSTSGGCLAQTRPQTAPPRDRRRDGNNMSKKMMLEWKAHQGLLASELVLLLSVVPSFYHHISEKNESVCNVLSVATGDHDLYLRLSQLAHELTLHGGDINSLYKEICKSVINRIELASMNTPISQDAVTSTENHVSPSPFSERMSSNTKQARFILNASYAYPRRPKSAALTSGERLSVGKRPSNATSYIQMIKPYDLAHLTLGSLVLLGPQNLAKVIAIPEQHIALVQMDLVTRSNGSVSVQAKNMDDHFCYVDVRKLTYDHQAGYWKPRGAIGDKITLQAEDVTLPNAALPASDYGEIERVLSSSKMEKHSPRVKERPSSSSRGPSPARRASGSPTSNALMLVSMDQEKVTDVTTNSHSPTTMRPLSALFCKKMDLSLAESTLQYKGFPQPRDDCDPCAERTGARDDLGISDTFLTEMKELAPIDSERLDDDDVNKGIAETKYKMEYQPDLSQYIDGEDWGFVASEENPVDTYLNSRVQLEEHCSDDSSLVDSQSSIKGTPELQRKNKTPEEEAPAASESQQEVVSSSSPVNIPMPSSRADPGMVTGEQENAEDGCKSPNNSLDDEHELQELAGDGEGSSDDDDKLVADLEASLLEDFSEKTEVGDRNLSLSGSQMLFHKPRAVDKKQRSQSAKVPKHRHPASKHGIQRPVSAILPQQKRVMFHDKDYEAEDSRPGSASSFQLRRTEAWRSSTSSGGFVEGVQGKGANAHDEFVVDRTALRRGSKVKFNMGVRRPPPQRPTSPDQVPQSASSPNSGIHADYLQVTTSQISIRSQEDGKPGPRKVQTSRWLAEGRNVHKEEFDHRRAITSPRLPGYLEGLSLQPIKQPLSRPAPDTDTALHSLPSRSVKPFATFPRTSYGRKYDYARTPSSLMTGTPLWHRPKFSSLGEVKKLSSKPTIRTRRPRLLLK